MVKNTKISTMRLDGGALCLDFINTVHNRKEMPLSDYLLSPLDFLAWSEKTGLIDEKSGKLMEQAFRVGLPESISVLAEAIALRELLFRIFHAVAGGKTAKSNDLAQFNQLLARYFPLLILASKQGKYVEEWNIPKSSHQFLLACITKEAYSLLLFGNLQRVKECSNCGWIFLDTTKNGKRKWCSMESCGSNVKALKWYYRQKS
jgi:predicted RNA-binding Zn ribbon-like protein